MNKSTMIMALWAAMGALAITLIIGLITMARGKDAARSNRLMQVRVGIQLLALLVFSLILWRSHG